GLAADVFPLLPCRRHPCVGVVEASHSRGHPSLFHDNLLREQWHKNLRKHNDNEHLRLEHICSPEAQKIMLEDAARALEEVMQLSLFPKEVPHCEEVVNLEKQKLEIDQEAEKQAKTELWRGL
ncbi:hypothetical protein KI387_020424, partial [Taxus chinensis]